MEGVFTPVVPWIPQCFFATTSVTVAHDASEIHTEGNDGQLSQWLAAYW